MSTIGKLVLQDGYKLKKEFLPPESWDAGKMVRVLDGERLAASYVPKIAPACPNRIGSVQLADMKHWIRRNDNFGMARVVSFYTENTGYAKECRILVGSLKNLDIPYHVEPIETKGSWAKNCNYKPHFILKMLEKFPKENIAWVDADAIFRRRPELFLEFDKDYDLMIHWNRKECLSGTILFKNCESNKALLRAWAAECDKHAAEWDQRTLFRVCGGYPMTYPGVRIGMLPREYVKIFDSHPTPAPPVIEHNQASRRLKRQVNKACRL